MTNSMYRLTAVQSYRGEAKATIYLRIKQGLLTPPIKMGRSSVWPESEIEATNAAIIAGKSDEEIKALVKGLIAGRQGGAQ